MREQFFQLAFTPAVQAQQLRYGSRDAYARAAGASPPSSALGSRETAFLEARDGFYLATVSETGWPYVQYRGGPAGVLKVLDPTTIGWADFRGNRQYVSVGNASVNARVSIIAMDYAARERLKILGHMTIEDADSCPDLAARLTIEGYRATIERVVTVKVDAFDWNCPQHITPRFTMEEVERAVEPLKARVAELEARLAAQEGVRS